MRQRTRGEEDMTATPLDIMVLSHGIEVDKLSDLVGKTVFGPRIFDIIPPPGGTDVVAKVADGNARITFSLSEDKKMFKAYSDDIVMEGVKLTVGLGDNEETGSFERACPNGLGCGWEVPDGVKSIKILKVEKPDG